MIENEKNGLLVTQQSPIELANAIQRLLNDNGLWKSIQREARKRIENDFDSQNVNKITGLLINTYFSGVKIRWVVENKPEIFNEEIFWGTIDSWLVWNLTNGKAI